MQSIIVENKTRNSKYFWKKIQIALHWHFKNLNRWKNLAQAPWVQCVQKKSKQRWIPVKFFKDKVQCSWALEAKSEFNLEMYRNQRSFWTMVVLLKFRILKFNSCTLDGSGEAMVEAGGQPSSGKTSFTIMLTKFVQNKENLRNWLGIFSCVLQTWHVKPFL